MRRAVLMLMKSLGAESTMLVEMRVRALQCNRQLYIESQYSVAGPDGCAIDFETSAVGTRVSGNYISHSWGAGVMVFGHTVRTLCMYFYLAPC